MRWHFHELPWSQKAQWINKSQQARRVFSMEQASTKRIEKRKSDLPVKEGGAKRATPGSDIVNHKRIRVLKGGKVGPGPVLYW